MIHVISGILIAVVCSLYYFPISLQVLPSVNSKMVVAVMGLAFWGWERMKRRSLSVRKDLFVVLCLGLAFSLSSYVSVVYNSTDDMVFATYFVSMCVWLGGAYCVVYLLRWLYGEVSLTLVLLYLGMVCAGQCVIAVVIDNMPALAHVVARTITGIDLEYFAENSRLYGIGASFDTAGIRFSCVLLGLAYLIKKSDSPARRNFCILLFLIIGMVGNMISRTTVVGIGVACGYLFLSSLSLHKITVMVTGRKVLWIAGGCTMLVLLYYVGLYMYNTMPGVRSAFEYGFEGFINLVENGTFSTHSSDLLLSHIADIWPDNTKTWIIGDGYFADPYDPSKFYMGTDMGYVRFFFYCGVTGFSFFLLYFIGCTYVLCKRCPHLTLFGLFLLITQLIVWVKIPTDIFCFYALLLLADTQKKPAGK